MLKNEHRFTFFPFFVVMVALKGKTPTRSSPRKPAKPPKDPPDPEDPPDPPSKGVGVLEEYGFGVAGGYIENFASGSKIRKPTRRGVFKMKGFLKAQGWLKTSSILVIEVTPPSVKLPHLEDAVSAWREDPNGTQPLSKYNTKISPHPTQEGMANIIEDPITRKKRFFEIQDGAHRHQAALELREELREAGETEKAAKFDTLQIIVLSRDTPPTATIQLAAQSNANNLNFIPTTNLDNITLFKRSHEVWEAMVTKQIVEIREMETAKLITKNKLSVAQEKAMLADTAWVRYLIKECEDRDQQLEDVYKLSKRSLAVWIATAKGFSDELVEHLAGLYDEDVSIYIYHTQSLHHS